MTYGFAKLVADNLRFGVYKDKIITYSDHGSVCITDVNSNTFIRFTLSKMVRSTYNKKWYSWRIQETITDEGIIVNVNTGTYSPIEVIAHHEFEISKQSPDYKFWLELQTFIQAKCDEKRYKHQSVIEDVFIE